MVGATNKIREGVPFSVRLGGGGGDTVGIIQRNKSVEHCFVLRDFIPLNVFK